MLRITLWCAVSFGGCAAFLYRTEDSPAVVKALADADALLAQGRFEDALRAYGEFVEHYPTSSIADAAYLRIAHLYLCRPDSLRGWKGWDGADYTLARDTLLALLEHYPGTSYRLEVENWIKLLDSTLRAADLLTRAQDSLSALHSARKEREVSLAQMEHQHAMLQRRLQRAEAEGDSLRALNRTLREQNAALEAEIRRIREETERMRRMLMNLERRRPANP